MNNLTQEQIDLQSHIETNNYKIRQDSKINNSLAITTNSDPLYWAEKNVYNLDDYYLYVKKRENKLKYEIESFLI